MAADEETVVHVTRDAAWLPRSGRAEVVRRSTPPTPMCVVRLLIRLADQVFCVVRADTGRLDLPMRVIERDDPSGRVGIAGLAAQIRGDASGLVFVGAVRNVVDSPSDDDAWPTPLAYFGVWTSECHPIVEGSWVSLGTDSPLRDRHWFPLVK